MKKTIQYLAISVVICLFFNKSFSQDLVSGGSNSWIFHTPDDGRTSLFVAPGTNSSGWDFNKQTQFYNDGSVQFSGAITSLKDIYSYQSIFTNGSLSIMNAGASVDIVKNQTGPWPNNTGFIFRTEKGGPNGSSVKVDALKIAHEGQAEFINHVSLSGNLYFMNMGYSVDIVKNQTGPYPNNTGFLFRTEMGGPAGASVKVDALSINHLGNVGIGTPNSGSFKLAVNGKIWSQEVNVAMTNPGPDYVFEKGYDLLSLSELETYINQNKHLPEVPSAKQMEAEGLNLKEMNLLLLKKVEELTLHLIAMKRENEIQQKEINALKKN
jgi:hypothetical protein